LRETDSDTMPNSTCSITSISDLLDKAHNNLLNVTATIAACPDICSLAWGKGNPDLSGIGVNISYIIQVVLTVVCGPILSLLYHFPHRFGIEENAKERLMDIHNAFVDASAGFNIPVGIAAAIRIGNSPIFEQSFLQLLVIMQTFSFLTVDATAPPIFEKNLTNHLTLLRFIQFLLFLIVYGLQSKNNAGLISGQELLKNCKTYAKIRPLFSSEVKLCWLDFPYADILSTRRQGFNMSHGLSEPSMFYSLSHSAATCCVS
jgi:hypothetical protein